MTKWNALYDRLRAEAPSLELRRDEPMSRHTSFRVGGPVPLMALPKTTAEAQAALKAAAELGHEPFFLGNGSNLLVSDRGTDRFILKTVDGLGGVEQAGDGQLIAGSGTPMARLANFALDSGLTGLEFVHGIPGSVGGGVFMNAGAYGGELSAAIVSVTALSWDGTTRELSVKDCGFGYRKSMFSGGTMLVTSARFALEPGNPAEIKAKMDDYAARRREKQPLEYPSAGSFFKRPEGHFAGALIEGCGLKGLSIGGAQVSEKHAGFLVNTGGATCHDILTLMDQVRERVLKETGVILEPEVRYLGWEEEEWNF